MSLKYNPWNPVFTLDKLERVRHDFFFFFSSRLVLFSNLQNNITDCMKNVYKKFFSFSFLFFVVFFFSSPELYAQDEL